MTIKFKTYQDYSDTDVKIEEEDTQAKVQVKDTRNKLVGENIQDLIVTLQIKQKLFEIFKLQTDIEFENQLMSLFGQNLFDVYQIITYKQIFILYSLQQGGLQC
ncbi:unnamed protein product [Paramecium primaurelia]|uniref:Brr2 N-terminal helicase PWI domain-containing protein n=1 Tax=Paramecium primaurelia TaxID=5886 RepID=A0A8S1PXJ4_PARPR|nr:unnamed protein product [Paramecium primaurelia]